MTILNPNKRTKILKKGHKPQNSWLKKPKNPSIVKAKEI